MILELVQFALWIRKMAEAVNEEDPDMLKEAIVGLQSEADLGNAHAQSTLGFLHWMGCGVPYVDAKAFLYHDFAKEGGNSQSKMALAYRYFRNQVAFVESPRCGVCAWIVHFTKCIFFTCRNTRKL